jgi:hypothetical protein
MKHDLSDFWLGEEDDVHLFWLETIEDDLLLALELAMDLAEEGVELDLLVLAELDCEDLVVDAVLVFVVALTENVFDRFGEVLLDEFLLDLLAGRELLGEGWRLAETVMLLAPNGLELMLFIVHAF